MAHPNVHFISELLEHMKELGLQIQRYRIFTTQGSNRIFNKSPTEGLLSIAQQEPEALNPTNDDSLQ